MDKEILKDSTILIVDDNPNNLDVLISSLEKYNCDVRVAINGKKALERVEVIMPDIILLDIVMPDIDGFEVCILLKQNEKTKNIPIIFMTALNDIVDEVKGFEIGAVDYITKPFKLEKVLARLTTQLTIQAQKKKLIELNATKDRFFSIIGHDLKSPFNNLITMISLITEHNMEITPEKFKKYMIDLKELTGITYKLLENLLKWAQSQQGRIAYTPEILNIHLLIQSNIDLLNQGAIQKKVRIINEVHPDIKVYADNKMLNTVIRNLISNAVKFTNAGDEIHINNNISDNSMIEISVRDTGIGIDEKYQEKLFRLDDQYTRNGTEGERGTGLGLILCKDFIEKNGGTIKFNSKKGEGSTFSFTIPKR